MEFAILETSGQLTVIEKNKGVSSSNQTGNSSSSAEQKEQNSGDPQSSRSSDKSDSSSTVKLPKHKIRYEGLPIPLIMDGKVQDDNLEMIGKNRFWLRTQIRQKGVSDFRDVFLCSIDHKGQIYIDPISPR